MTLSQTAALTRQIITLSIIVLVLGTISFIGYRIWYANYIASLPPVEEKPDAKFGLLPLLDFPKAAVSTSNFSYSVDTSTGNLPKVGVDPGFEKLIKVFFVTKPVASLLSAEKSQNMAAKFGIQTEPEILSETQYRFKSDNKTLTVDLDSGNFTFQNNLTNLEKKGLDEDKKLISDFVRTLENLGIFNEDLRGGRNKIIRASEDVAQISLWPSPVDKKLIFTPQFDTSLINARIYKSADNLENFLSLNFTYYPIDTTTFATYLLKTAEDAFADLKSGKGVVIIEPSKANVSITSVYLGYFMGEFYTAYLQPIFVFEGPHFVAYVPAVSEQYQTR